MKSKPDHYLRHLTLQSTYYIAQPQSCGNAPPRVGATPAITPAGWHHILNRGMEKRAISSGPDNYRHFLELLSELPERYQVAVHDQR